jgi:MFS family permease
MSLPPAASDLPVPRPWHPSTGLWRHADFLKLWAAQTISKLGSGITANALPLIAVLVLGAGAVEMGVLVAASSAPVVVLGLIAGAWVDRLPRRPVLIWTDLARAVLLASLPVAALIGQLRMEHLVVVAAAVGVLTVFFDVAYQSFVPDLVTREHVLDANSKLAGSDAVAEITTPGLTGLLVAVISAPLVILLDALSFVASALAVGAIRAPEPARSGHPSDQAPAAPGRPGRLWQEIVLGLRTVAGSPLLRSLAGYAAARTFFGSFIGPLYALYALRELALGPVLLGITIGIGGASNLLGTILVQPITRRFGAGPTMLGAALLGALTVFLIPLAQGPVLLAFALLAVGQAFDAVYPLYDVNALSLRQSVTPRPLMGRVNASMQVLEGGLAPVGALVGGLLGQYLGVRATLLAAAAGIMISTVWLCFSPLRRHGPPLAPHAAAGGSPAAGGGATS